MLFTPLDADCEKATIIVKATCALHNMLCTVHDNAYIPAGYADQPMVDGNVVDGFWRQENNLPALLARGRNHAAAASEVRTQYAAWFSAEGATEWQDQHINRLR